MEGRWARDSLVTGRRAQSARTLRGVMFSPSRCERGEHTSAENVSRAATARARLLHLPGSADDQRKTKTVQHGSSFQIPRCQVVPDARLQSRVAGVGEDSDTSRPETIHGARSLALGPACVSTRGQATVCDGHAHSDQGSTRALGRWALVRAHTKKQDKSAFAALIDKVQKPFSGLYCKPITKHSHFLSLHSLLFA